MTATSARSVGWVGWPERLRLRSRWLFLQPVLSAWRPGKRYRVR